MGLYDIDYKNAGVELLPPDKRTLVIPNYLWTLLSPLQWLRDIWLGSYRTGSDAQTYIAGTYAKGQRVIYKQRVYESRIDNNTDLPTVQASWLMIQENFIGVFERVLYNGTTLTFEYGINKYFGTVFRQPPNRSDIYLEVLPRPLDVFVVGGVEAISNVVFGGSSSGYVIDSYSFGTYYNMNIYVPSLVYNSLDPVAMNCEKIIRNFADKYIVAGIVYRVIPY